MPSALRCDIRIGDFWNMTLKEITIVCESFAKNKEYEICNLKSQIYYTSLLTANFTALAFNGKPLPSYEDIWGNNVSTETQQDKNDILVTERFKDFVRNHNRGGK